jgi:hypothetical protein
MRNGLIAPRDRDDLVASPEQWVPAISDFKTVVASVFRVVEPGIKKWSRSIRSRIESS